MTAQNTNTATYTKEQQQFFYSMTEDEAAQALCLLQLMRMEPRDPKFSELFERSKTDPKPLSEFINTLLATKAYHAGKKIN